MKTITSGRIILGLVFIFLSFGNSLSNPAFALPLFAKKYNLSCPVCHEAFPKLNDVGVAFKENGYQMGSERDTPLQNPVVSPFSFRTTPIVTYKTQTNVPTDQENNDTVSTGTADVTGLDILSGGVLAQDISYLIVLSPFLDNKIDLEAAWVRFSNLFGSSWANLKVGKHELYLPFSEKRSFFLTEEGADYLAYGYHPGGVSNLNTFDFGHNQMGLEFSGHSPESRIRYALDINNGSVEGSNQALGTKPDLYGHFSYKVDQEMTSEKFGLLGSYGWWPLNYKTTSNGVTTTDIPGTGSNYKASSRLGGYVVMDIGSSGTPLASIGLLYLYGIDDGSLVGSTPSPLCPVAPCPDLFAGGAGGTRDGIFTGGSLEVNFMPNLNTVFFNHYDWIINKQQADISFPSDYKDQNKFTTGIRHYLHQSIYTLIALHGELGYAVTKKTNLVTGDDQTTLQFLLGVDYAF